MEKENKLKWHYNDGGRHNYYKAENNLQNKVSFICHHVRRSGRHLEINKRKRQ